MGNFFARRPQRVNNDDDSSHQENSADINQISSRTTRFFHEDGHCVLEDCAPNEEPLHTELCSERCMDIMTMLQRIEQDPYLLRHPQRKSDANARVLDTIIDQHHGPDTSMLPLHDCIMRGHVLCAKFLIKSGAAVNLRSPSCDHGLAPLELAITFFKEDEEKYLKMIKMLLDLDANPNKILNGMVIPDSIVKAAKLNSKCGFLVLQALLQHGAVVDLEIKNNDGQQVPIPENHIHETNSTAVNTAIAYKSHAALKELLLHGAINKIYIRHTITETNQICPPLGIFILAAHVARYEDQDDSENLSPQANSLCALQALKIHHQFGGNLWETDDGGHENPELDVLPGNILETMRMIPELKERLPGLEANVSSLMSTPRTLKEIARLKIMSTMGKGYKSNTMKLLIPETLKQFLHFNDLELKKFK